MSAKTANGITYPTAGDAPSRQALQDLATSADAAVAGRAAAKHTHAVADLTNPALIDLTGAASYETAITTFPTGWANFGSDSGGSYLPLRIQRLGLRTAVMHGMLKASAAMTASSTAETATGVIPTWALPRENALAFFGRLDGGVVRVGLWTSGKWSIYTPTALAAGQYFAFSITYPLVSS